MSGESAVFAVERLRWASRRLGPASRFWHRVPAADAVAAFPDRASADAERRRLEANARVGADPFLLGGPALFYQTSLDAGRLNDWLLDHDVPLPATPPADHLGWRKWWGNNHKNLTGPQREAVWGALDKARHYRVSERPGQAAYAVVAFAWKVGGYPGDPLESDSEGGHLHGLFHEGAAAAAAAYRLQGEVRDQEREAQQDGVNHDTYDVHRLSGQQRREASVEEASFTGVLAVPLMDEAVRRRAFLLSRPAYDEDGAFSTDRNGDPTRGEVPLALFATREAAEAERRRREDDARRRVNPFAFTTYQHGLGSLTDLLFERFKDEVAALGVAPPRWKSGAKHWPELRREEFWPHAWEAWWDERVDGMSDARRDGVWALLGRLRFHAVTEVTVEG